MTARKSNGVMSNCPIKFRFCPIFAGLSKNRKLPKNVFDCSATYMQWPKVKASVNAAMTTRFALVVINKTRLKIFSV